MLHQFSCPEDGAVENEVKQKTPNMYPQYMYHVINYSAPFFPHNTGQSCASLKPISVQTFGLCHFCICSVTLFSSQKHFCWEFVFWLSLCFIQFLSRFFIFPLCWIKHNEIKLQLCFVCFFNVFLHAGVFLSCSALTTIRD